MEGFIRGKTIYWETSAVNFMVDRYSWNDAVATKAFHAARGTKFYLSPVTIWELLLTGDEKRREDMIVLCQHLFHENLLNSPAEFILNFIAQGCPLYERKYVPHSRLDLAKVWKNINGDMSQTFRFDHAELKERMRVYQDLSRSLDKIIYRVVFDVETRDAEHATQEFIRQAHGWLRDDRRSADGKRVVLQKIALLFMLYVLCIGVEHDNTPINQFWRVRGLDGVFDRFRFLIDQHEILVYRGPFAEMATMAYHQMKKGATPGRGLLHDCLHCIYLTYVDWLFTADEHFRALRSGERHVLFSRIIHVDELKFEHHAREITPQGVRIFGVNTSEQ